MADKIPFIETRDEKLAGEIRGGENEDKTKAARRKTIRKRARQLARRLGAAAALVRRGFLGRDCQVSDAVLDALCNVPRALPLSVRGIVTVAAPPARPLVLSPDADADVNFDAVPLLLGPAGVGKEALLTQACDRPVWTLDLAGILALDAPERTLMKVCAEAAVAGCALHLRMPEAPTSVVQLRRFGAILAEAGVPWAMSAVHDEGGAALMARVRRHRLPAPDSRIQQQLWSTLIGDDAIARRLAGLFRLTPGRIIHAAAVADSRSLSSLSDAVRAGCSHRLADLADPVRAEAAELGMLVRHD